jgi:hypothetical protein
MAEKMLRTNQLPGPQKLPNIPNSEKIEKSQSKSLAIYKSS